MFWKIVPAIVAKGDASWGANGWIRGNKNRSDRDGGMVHRVKGCSGKAQVPLSAGGGVTVTGRGPALGEFKVSGGEVGFWGFVKIETVGRLIGPMSLSTIGAR